MSDADLAQRQRIILQLYSGLLVKAVKEFSEAIETKTAPPVTLADLNGGIRAFGSEVRALQGATANRRDQDNESIPAEPPSRLKLLRPTGKLQDGGEANRRA